MTVNLSNKRISRNVVVTVSQVVVSGIVFFIIYRYLYDRLGVEQVGIWSLVLATTSVSRIGDLGLSAGVVRFVAQALGRGDFQRAADVVQTVALTLGVLMATLLVVGHPLFVLALNYLVPVHCISSALSILPYALTSLWVMVAVSVFIGGLDGCMCMYLRSLFVGLSHLAYLGLTILLVPKYGLEGMAMAQLIQSIGLMILLWWMLRRQLVELPVIPLHWKFPVLKEMISYGVNFQIITVMNMLFDPIMKALMSKFAGLEALGYYEMANKFIQQCRAIIVEASRVMVPAIATLHEHDSVKATRLFEISYRMTFYVAVLFYGSLGISITTVSMLWLGHYQAMFIQFALLLNFGWFANTISVPAYFANLGSGNLRENMIGQVILGTCSPCVGFVLGMLYGGVGVVFGAIAGLIVGSMFLVVSHMKQANLSWSTFIIPQHMTTLMVIGALTTIFSNYGRDQSTSFMGVIGIALLCSIPLLIFGWFNPVRRVLLNSKTR